MITQISYVTSGLLALTLAFVGAWMFWGETSSREAWALDEPMRTFTDFTPRKKMDAVFRLRNKASVPLRIVGASTC